MDHREAGEWLDAAWNEAVHELVTCPDPEVDALANSDVSSIRYALVTRMLGKIADPARSPMAFQLGEAVEGARDARLTLAHVQEASRKAKRSSDGLSNFLFAVPGIQERDSAGIEDLTHRSWAEGLNLYAVTIPALIGTAFVLLEESWRVRFLREIGNELDERGNQPARQAWDNLLRREELP